MSQNPTEENTTENTETTEDTKTDENVTGTGSTTETEETEYYVDPEGNYWTSKAEYDAYMAIQVSNGLTR